MIGCCCCCCSIAKELCRAAETRSKQNGLRTLLLSDNIVAYTQQQKTFIWKGEAEHKPHEISVTTTTTERNGKTAKKLIDGVVVSYEKKKKKKKKRHTTTTTTKTTTTSEEKQLEN